MYAKCTIVKSNGNFLTILYTSNHSMSKEILKSMKRYALKMPLKFSGKNYHFPHLVRSRDCSLHTCYLLFFSVIPIEFCCVQLSSPEIGIGILMETGWSSRNCFEINSSFVQSCVWSVWLKSENNYVVFPGGASLLP